MNSHTLPSHSHARFEAFFEQKARQDANADKLMKVGVWAYFLLLIFEGALRKWVFPSLASPLLLVRDPVAMWLLFQAWQQGKLKPNLYITGMVGIGVIGIFTSYFFGHGNLLVALYGARILLLHFPLMFVIGEVFNRDDVVNIGKVTLWIAIPMVILIGIQFFSPQNAFVNIGVGGDESGAGFSGALGYFRPPGTFSFTNGNSLFFSFVALFVFYFWLSSDSFNKIILILATAALLAAIPLSISRSLFFSIGITFLFSLIAVSRRPQYFNRILGASFGIFFLGALLSQASFAATAIDAFIARFTQANENEGGLQSVLLDRYLGGMIGALQNSAQIPYFGLGLGMGTNVGAVLLIGKSKFLISEGEWGRVIGEMGALFGILIIFLRLGFCIDVTARAYRRLAKADFLPWILLSFALLNIPQGKWAQATALGFSTLIGGLVLASMNSKSQQTN